jgi:hypothetical protein
MHDQGYRVTFPISVVTVVAAPIRAGLTTRATRDPQKSSLSTLRNQSNLGNLVFSGPRGVLGQDLAVILSSLAVPIRQSGPILTLVARLHWWKRAIASTVGKNR